MERIIGIDALDDKGADERVKLLNEKYPNFSFEHRPHDTRKEFVVMDVTPNAGQPLLDQMKRTAEGLDPQVEETDVNDPVVTAGVTAGANDGAPPAGGGATA